MITATRAKPDELLERHLHSTTSLCRECKEAVPARVVAVPDGSVWMKKVCPDHGAQSAMLSTDAAWYERTRAIPTPVHAPRKVVRTIDKGCPFDCGACEAHAQRVRLPVVTITSSCNTTRNL